MDARGQALKPTYARGAIAGGLLALLAGAVVCARASADPGFAGLELHELYAAEILDAETVAELDDLLHDPVDLNRGDLERLRHLPWLDAAAIEALRAARPLADWDALSRVPGWSEDRVRLSSPFVQLVAPAPAPWRAELASRALRARTELLARASTSHARLELRRTSEPLLLPTGYATARLGGFRLAAGDLKANHAQGLLWASGSQALRAGSQALRHGRGNTGTTALDRARVVRGAALEARAGPFAFEIVSGTHASARVEAGAVQLTAGATRVRAAALRRATDVWLGSEIRRDVGRAGAALEIVRGRGGVAWALAARAGQRSVQLAARLEHAAAEVSPFAAVLPRTRGALAEVTWRHARVTVLVAVAAIAGTDTLGTDRRERDQALEARWSGRPVGLEARWSERRARDRGIGVEAPEADAERVLRRLMARLRWQRRSLRAWVEHRSVELVRSHVPAESGSSWQVGVEAARRPWRAALACTAFRVTHGHAAPVVPEPGLGGGAAAWRLHGDGLRAAAGLRFDHAHLTCQVRAAWQVTAPRTHEPLVEAALHLRKS